MADLMTVTVTISSSPKHGLMSIRIRDLGGGVPPAELKNIFSYAYTTVNRTDVDDDIDSGPYGAQQNAGAGIFSGIAQAGMQMGLGTLAG